MESNKNSSRSAALVDINEAIKLEPGNAYYWRQKAVVLDDLDEYEQALPCVEKSVQLDPKLDVAWQAKASVLDHLGRGEEALTAANQAVRLVPSGNNLKLLAAVLAHAKKFAEAEAVLDRALKDSPADEIMRTRRANVARHTKHWDKVITDLTYVVKKLEKKSDLNLSFLNNLVDLTDALVQTKRYDEATVACKHGLKMFPDNRQLHDSLLAVYKATGNKAGIMTEERALKSLDTDYQPLK